MMDNKPKTDPIKTIDVMGVKMEVRPDHEIDEHCEVWVCARVTPGRPSCLLGAQEDYCTECGHAVWYDPRMAVSKPRKMCIECVVKKYAGKKSPQIIINDMEDE